MQNVAVLPRIIVGEHSVSDLLVYTKCLKSFDPSCLIILMMYLLAGIVGGPVVSLDTVGVLPRMEKVLQESRCSRELSLEELCSMEVPRMDLERKEKSLVAW